MCVHMQHMHTRTHTHARAHTHAHTHIHTHTHSYMYACTVTCTMFKAMLMHTHTYTHIHTHTYMLAQSHVQCSRPCSCIYSCEQYSPLRGHLSGKCTCIFSIVSNYYFLASHLISLWGIVCVLCREGNLRLLDLLLRNGFSFNGYWITVHVV